MNREIKFRIWCNNRFYYKCLVGNTTDTNDKNWTCPMVWLENKKEWVNCDNGIISQYTGLKDKKGVEIYEGDIVKCFIDGEYHNLIVEYSCGAFSTTYHSGNLYKINDYLYRVLTKNYNEDYEVIGNIYESEATND